MLNSVDVLKPNSGQMNSVIVELRASRNDLNKREKKLKKDEARAAELKAEKAARKASIQSGIAQAQQLKSGLEVEIGQLQEEQKRFEAQLAREAAARLRAQQAA